MSQKLKYILFKIICEGYLHKYYNVLFDTGAVTSICKENCLSEREKLKTPINIKGFNEEGNQITHYQENVKIQIWDKILIIPLIYCFELKGIDIIIGMNFIKQYLPVHIGNRYTALTKKNTPWIKGDNKITQKLQILSKINHIEIIIFNLDFITPINHKLENLYNENPLANWDKHKSQNRTNRPK